MPRDDGEGASTAVAPRGAARAMLSSSELLAVDCDRRLRVLFDLLDAGLANAPTRETAARIAHVSIRTLERLFRRVFGRTYSRWIEARRVSIAVSAIRALPGSLKARDVARIAGLHDRRRLLRAFRRQTGATPSGRTSELQDDPTPHDRPRVAS